MFVFMASYVIYFAKTTLFSVTECLFYLHSCLNIVLDLQEREGSIFSFCGQVLYYIILYYIILYYIILYYIILYYIILYHIISYHIRFYYIISYHIISYYDVVHVTLNIHLYIICSAYKYH